MSFTKRTHSGLLGPSGLRGSRPAILGPRGAGARARSKSVDQPTRHGNRGCESHWREAKPKAGTIRYSKLAWSISIARRARVCLSTMIVHYANSISQRDR
jgi:hypothetical protein